MNENVISYIRGIGVGVIVGVLTSDVHIGFAVGIAALIVSYILIARQELIKKGEINYDDEYR